MLFRSGLVLLVALSLAGCSALNDAARVAAPGGDAISRESVSGTPGSVGGKVSNSAPSVTAFSPSATSGENRGSFVVVFSGTVKDPNAERQFKNLSVAGTGPAALGAGRDVTSADVATDAEPASFDADGFKVWNPVDRDGLLSFQYRQTFPAGTPAGTYTFRAHVADRGGFAGVSDPVTITLTAFSDITISPTPVDRDGNALTGQNWGQWTAEAGAANVASTNFVRLENTGDAPNTRVVIDFEDAFVGTPDANYSIPVSQNVQFAWFEDATPATSAPSEGTFDFLPANADDVVTLEFTGKGNVIYVQYRIVQLPEILPVQSYGISFTVTEL